MTELSTREMREVWHFFNFPKEQRDMHDIDDWGDEETVTACLKRRETDRNVKLSFDFGIYLGKISRGYIVGITNLSGNIIRGECFATDIEMKARWILD